MHDRRYSGSLVVASAGPEAGATVTTGFGEMRCRSGANLKYTTADAQLAFAEWSADERVPPEAHVLLINPKASEFKSAIEQVSNELAAFPQGETGIDMYFAGHGLPSSGALVFDDFELTASAFIAMIKENMLADQGIRGISMMLDSCYSGAFLFNTLVELQSNNEAVRLYDALCSSMHDEKSWELSFLGHGAFTYTHFHKGNKHVDSAAFAKAIDEQDQATIARCVQGLVGMMADPATFLTQGRQHTIDCIKGGGLSTKTRGSIDLNDLGQPFNVEMIVDAFQRGNER